MFTVWFSLLLYDHSHILQKYSKPVLCSLKHDWKNEWQQVRDSIDVKAFNLWDQKWTKQDAMDIVASLPGDQNLSIRRGAAYWEGEVKPFWTERCETKWMVQLVQQKEDLRSTSSIPRFSLHPTVTTQVINLTKILSFHTVPGQNWEGH